MSDIDNDDIPMAQCGACDSIVPLDSESCPECGISFSGVTDEQLGECGACSAIIPIDSESCPECGASFVEVPETDDVQESAITDDSQEIADNVVVTEPAIAIEPIDDSTHGQDRQTDVEVRADMDAEESIPEASNEIYEDVPEVEDLPEVETIEVSQSIEAVVEQEVDTTVEEQVHFEAEEESEDIEVEEVDIAPIVTTTVVDEAKDDETIVEDSTVDDDSATEVNVSETQDEAAISEEIDDHVDELSDEDDISTEALLEELQDDEDTTEGDLETDSELEQETTEDESASENVEEAVEEATVVMAFENLALAIAGTGMTAGEVFGEMDTSEDNLIDAPELQKGIKKIAGEKMSPKEVTAILNYLDKDGDRRVNPNELVQALDDLRIGIKPGKLPKVKTFPSPMQKFLMGKKANDIFYPIAYFLMVTFIGLWVVNGMGLLVDGTGGTVVYEGGVDQWGGEIREGNWNLCQSDALDEMIDPCQGTVVVGETYPCDPALDANKCENSLTPFSGENGASSMPAGFYSDGIFMIILGVIGLCAIAYLHLVYAKSLREKVKKLSGKSEEEDEEDVDEDGIEEESAEDEEEIEEDDEEEFEDDDDEEFEDDDDEEFEDDDDEDEDIDIGDWIGLELDGKEYFGEIVEFDDDEGTVTIETEDGDEITGDQDDMFIE